MYLDSLIANSAALADSDYGTVIDEEMVDKAIFGGETGRYFGFCDWQRPNHHGSRC